MGIIDRGEARAKHPEGDHGTIEIEQWVVGEDNQFVCA